MVALANAVGRALRAPGLERAIDQAERRVPWPANRLVVLTYHRIDRPDSAADGRDPRMVSATPEGFAGQMAILRRNFNPVSVETVVAAAVGQEALPERAVLVTFDDAVDDFAEHAAPVLARFDLPAAVFVPTAFAGRADGWFWWDALHAAFSRTGRRSLDDSPLGPLPLATSKQRLAAARAVRRHLKEIPWAGVTPAVTAICQQLEVEPPAARVMAWSTLASLPAAGVAVCAHTRTHPHLDRMPVEDATAEIVGSLDDVRSHLGFCPPVFAYPSGRHDPGVVRAAEEAGVSVAFTTERGPHRFAVDHPMLVRRINVSRRTGSNATRLQMLPWADRLLLASAGDRGPGGS